MNSAGFYANMPTNYFTYFFLLTKSGSHVAVVQDDSALKWEALAFCDVVFVFGGMPEKAVHFMFPKGSKFVNLFNEASFFE